MPSAPPILSICVPILNAMPYLIQRMDSIFAQDFKDFEIIIGDSYSTDGSWEYIQSLHDPRIRAYQIPRQGIYAGWNACIQRAQGEFIHIATADDFEAPNFYSTLLSILQKHPDIPLAYSALKFVDEKNQPVPCPLHSKATYQRLHQKTGILPQIPCHLYAVIYYPPWVSMNSALYRRSIHKQLGLWPTDALSFADCLFARDYFVHYQAYYEPSTQAFWRQHPQQASQSQPSNKNKQNLYVLKLFDHIKKLSYIPTYKKELSADLISLLTQLYYLFAINRNGKKTSLKIKLAFYIDIIRKVLSEKLPASILHSSRIPAHLIQTLIETTFTELLSEKKDFTTLLSQSIYEFKNRKIKLHYHHKLPHLTTLPAQLCPRQNNFPSFTTVLFYHDNPSTNNTVSFNRLETVLSPNQTQIITLPSLKDLVVDRLLDAIYNTSADYLFFLDANETPFPDALPLLLSLAKAHPEIPWFIPNSTAIYEETQYCPNNSLDKKNINSNHFEYYTFLPFYPARFPYIFSQTPFTASGSLVKKENLLKILSTSASQELRTHTSEYFLITALALSIKPAFVCSPIVMKSRKSHLENLFHWTNFIQTHTPKEWRAKLKTYLNEENLRDYYTYPLIEALRIFGPPQSLTYKWAKRKLLSRKLKQRHSITIFISDPTKVSWNKNESFFLKSF